MQRRRNDVWGRLRLRAGALALLLPLTLLPAATPAAAESYHWGDAAVRLSMHSYYGSPVATDPPGSTTWSFWDTTSYGAVWHRGAEVTVGEDLDVWGSLSSTKENTLGALGTATMSLHAPASVTSSEFTAVVTGQYRRTQTLFQFELNGTASDGNGEVVPVRVTGSGPWRPKTGDGVLNRITDADVPMDLVLVFPGNIPPPPGPKAASVIAFDGDASLPAFPCPPPLPGQMPCTGTFDGKQTSAFAGDNAAGLWSLMVTSPLTTSFTYADLIQPGAPCVEGTAAGTLDVADGSGQVVGVWTNRVDVPLVVIGAQVSMRFTWDRVGSVAVLTLADVSLWIHVPGPKGWIQVIEPDSSTAPAVAAFLPAVTQEHLIACQEGRQGPAITAAVHGAASIEGL